MWEPRRLTTVCYRDIFSTFILSKNPRRNNCLAYSAPCRRPYFRARYHVPAVKSITQCYKCNSCYRKSSSMKPSFKFPISWNKYVGERQKYIHTEFIMKLCRGFISGSVTVLHIAYYNLHSKWQISPENVSVYVLENYCPLFRSCTRKFTSQRTPVVRHIKYVTSSSVFTWIYYVYEDERDRTCSVNRRGRKGTVL
jgi:hypothetical protein